MARSNQYSRGLQLILASIVLVIFLAITVESRAVSFTAPILPELTGKVNSGNRRYVGQALAYVGLRGKSAFGLSVLAVSNIDPTDVTRVAVYITGKPKQIVANLQLNSGGLYTYDNRVNFTSGVDVQTHRTSVGFWVKNKLVITGPLANNRTTFVAYLQADQVITTPVGTRKNDAFGVVHLSKTGVAGQYFVTATVNHDLDETVTGITINGPAPSGAANTAWSIPLTFARIQQAGKSFQVQVNSTVYFWMTNQLTYLSIATSKNPNGALRGQIVPLSNQRLRIPLFSDSAVKIVDGTEVTFLPDGSSIIGNTTVAFSSLGASKKNSTIGFLDPKVAYLFGNASNNFQYDFRFPLPVALVNKYSVRGAWTFLDAASDIIAASNVWQVGAYDYSTDTVSAAELFTIPTLGNQTYTPLTADLGPDQFDRYLGPGGIYTRIVGSAISTPLHVDRFYTLYYVASAAANNIVRDIFFRGSDVQTRR